MIDRLFSVVLAPASIGGERKKRDGMCGLAGFWSVKGPGAADREAILRQMGRTIAHRGPDADGFWRDDEAGIAFVHRRLSILDLSPAGAQPMESACGRFVIIFNGEIYNHLILRDELAAAGAAPPWRGHSDTETLLAAIVNWGLRGALERLTGMFAFALWDRRQRTLSLARDRLGEKPLYYGWSGQTLLFGSELKALRAYPGFSPEIDGAALTSYLRFSCVPAPLTIYEHTRKLSPGQMAVFTAPTRDAMQCDAYWSVASVAAAGETDRWTGSSQELSERLEQLLIEVVGSQMLSDVPLGAFLSGGIDSSLVTALMCAQHGAGRVRTFSIGFASQRFNEAEHARAVAAHLGTDHAELMVTEDDTLALVPDLPHMFDEPFADSSAIPTAILCRMTRRAVTVALSGDGGDEVFGGYNRHVEAPRLWHYASRVPTPLRRTLTPATAALQMLATGRRAELVAGLAQRLGLPKTAADKLAKFGSAIGRADSFPAFYREIVSTWPDPGRVTGTAEPGDPAAVAWPSLHDPGEQIMAMDAIGYLPDDILVKVDRSAMATSLETRAPFLDKRVVEAAWHLPPNAKIVGRVGKKILRDILHRHVPRAIVDRPKQGFAVPIDDWLRGRLRDWAENLLSREALNAAGLFDATVVRRAWDAHSSGVSNAGMRLWAVLMAQAWHADVHQRR